MRSFWILSLCFLSFSTSTLSQRLTLEESVRQQFTTFAPEDLEQLQWLPGTDQYVYVKDTMIILGSPKKGESNFLSLKALNLMLGPNRQTSFPQMTWMSSDKFYFESERKMITVDLKTKAASFTHVYNEKAQNTAYDKVQQHYAYTIGSDLYADLANKEVRITNNEPGIVSGQSISRNEYGINNGIFWSGDGNKIAFYQKNEKDVTDYPLTDYTTVPASVKNIKYPMAGAASEYVAVGVYDIRTGSTIFLDLNYGRVDDKFYATNLAWAPDHKTVYIAWLSRDNKLMQMKTFDSETGKEIRVVFTEKDEKWLEPTQPIKFIPNHPNEILWMSERDGYTQLCMYFNTGEFIRKSNNAFDIIEVLGFDKMGEIVYVAATGENPTEMHTYAVKLADMSMTKLTKEPGTHRATVASVGGFMLDQYSNTVTPNTINLVDPKGVVKRNLITAKNPFANRTIGKTELFTIKSTNGMDLHCRLIKPSNFDPSKKYPVVVYLYNGPHVQLVTNSWLGGASLWMHYLAEDGFLVFTVDGRGSDNRGKAFEQAIHRQLGTSEIDDQMAGVEWLKSQPYVDASRMGIHGWSFGGFMTTSMMLRKPGTFKVGVAGGPVIDWRLYEVMYTERYMDTPIENPEGYKTADLTNYVKNLQGKLLMIHGTDDDVVVMQHNMKFQKACIEQGMQVDFFAYPGHAHNVRGKDRVHLMKKVIDYLEKNI